MKQINWKDIDEAQEFVRPGAGGYVCRIVDVEDVPDKEYLLVYLDIAEGEFKDYGKKYEKSTGQSWGYQRMYRSYKEKALNFFAAFLGDLERSNPGKFTKAGFDGDEQKLIGLSLGVVLGQEEYKKQDGSIGVRTAVKQLTTPQKIHDGDFKIPAMKKLDRPDTQQPEVINDADLPF